MDAMDIISRADFRRLINRSDAELTSHREKRDCILWSDDVERAPGVALAFIAYDAALFLTGFWFASDLRKGKLPNWEAARLALPALQYCLRDGIDRRDCYASIMLPSRSEIVVGCGTFPELLESRAIGGPHNTFFAPLDPIKDLLRKRAREHGVALPKTLSPPLTSAPAWAHGDPQWTTKAGAARVTWQPQGAFALATLN